MSKGTEPAPKQTHIRAVPWKTPLTEQVKGALGEIPSYIRRVRDMERGIEELFDEARETREGLLEFVCLRFRRLLDLLSEAQGANLPDQTIVYLGVILAEVEALPAFLKLRIQPRDLRGSEQVRKALAELSESIRRFNVRWEDWVEQEVPLEAVNRLIDAYNRNYRIEKQCALRYVPLDKIDFTHRDLLTPADLFAALPPLPEC